PASWLYVAYRLGWWFTLLSARLIYLLVMELAVVTLCAIAYLYSKWPLPTWANTILLLVHFAFIQTVCFGPYFWRGTQSLVTLAGLCSSLAWGLYVSDQRGQATQHG